MSVACLRRRPCRVRATVAAVAVLAVSAGAQDRPLPDQEVFLEETRKHLQTDYSLQSRYTYVETRRELKLDKHGSPTNESVKVFENYPGLPGEGRWERLIAENGRPVPPKELEKRDRERARKAEALAKRLATEPAREHERQVRDWEKHRRDTLDAVEDIFVVYVVEMLGRERIDGHDTIVLSLTPRPDPRPRTREGRMMRHFTVRAWVSESDHELVRLDAEAIETVSFGLGLLARMHKGARLTFERRKVNDEVWLPAVSRYSGSARVGLIRTLRRAGISEYSDYRKFDVDTSTGVATPLVADD